MPGAWHAESIRRADFRARGSCRAGRLGAGRASCRIAARSAIVLPMPAFYFDVGGVIVSNAPGAETLGDRIIPETLTIVERLLERGEKVGLATAFSRPWLEHLIAMAPVLRGTTICCSSDAGAPKPARAFFAHAQQLVGTTDIVFVDDADDNVRAARAYGWTAILAEDGWQRRFADRYLCGERSASSANPGERAQPR